MTVYVSAYGLCPPIVDRVECKVGSRSEPDLCTDEGGTRVSAYVARLANKNMVETPKPDGSNIRKYSPIERCTHLDNDDVAFRAGRTRVVKFA